MWVFWIFMTEKMYRDIDQGGGMGDGGSGGVLW
jgi:hypothetical protein